MSRPEAWNYFHDDVAYTRVLAERLKTGIEMDSAIGLGQALNAQVSGDLDVLDFGSGPGHYYPVLKRLYTRGTLCYRGIDIIPASVELANAHFAEDPDASFALGSVLEPAASYRGETCILAANTLPHVPTIEPLMRFIADTPAIRALGFRMLVGAECVQIRKHLSETSFDTLFDDGYQFNNIYSVTYLRHLLGTDWELTVLDDYTDPARLAAHSIPAQQENPFYGNRVSRNVAGMTFKGDVYMPWGLVIGQRRA